MSRLSRMETLFQRTPQLTRCRLMSGILQVHLEVREVKRSVRAFVKARFIVFAKDGHRRVAAMDGHDHGSIWCMLTYTTIQLSAVLPSALHDWCWNCQSVRHIWHGLHKLPSKHESGSLGMSLREVDNYQTSPTPSCSCICYIAYYFHMKFHSPAL